MAATREPTPAPNRSDSTLHHHNHRHSNVDTGWAWVVLVGCFVNSCLSAGVFSSFGVFIVDWQEQITESLTQIQWILFLVSGIPMMIAPVASALCKFYTIRQVVMVGSLVSTSAFFASWFVTSINHLYITFALAAGQICPYLWNGFGIGFIYQPSMIILAYYFDKRLARAMGISCGGTAMGNFALPPLFQLLIHTYGWNGALLVISALVANAAMFGALFRASPLELSAKIKSSHFDKNMNAEQMEYKPDVEQTSKEEKLDDMSKSNSCYRFVRLVLKSFDFHLLANIRFILILIANFTYGLAYTIVIQYLPARAEQGGVSPINAALLLTISGSVSIIIRFTHGYIIDYNILTARTLTALSFLLAALACAFFPLSDKYGILGLLSALIGVASGVFNVTVPIVAKEYVGVKRVSGAVGLLLLATGTGVFVGLYLSGILYDNTGSYRLAFFLAAGSFFISSILLFVDPLVRKLIS